MSVNFRTNTPGANGYGTGYGPKPQESSGPQPGGAPRPGPRPGWSGNTPSPRRPAGGGGPAGAGAAPRNGNPFAQSARSGPQTSAQRLLSNFSIAEIDGMQHRHLAQVVEHLGAAASQIPSDAKLQANWHAFRVSCHQQGLDPRQEMLHNPMNVAQFLINGPPRRQSAPPAPPPPPPGASGAKPEAASPQQVQARKMLAVFKMSEIDKMGHEHLAQVVQNLGIPASQIPADAQLAANWKAFRREAGNDHKAATKIIDDPGKIAAFLVNGPPRRPSGPQAGAGGSIHQPAAPETRPADKPAHNPVAIVGMDRKEALQALKDRGMSTEMLQEMKQDMRKLVNNGDGAMAAELQKKYAPYIKDDLTNGDNHVHFAKMLMQVGRDAPAA
jgi:uncharacterized phage-associated protein